MGRERRNIDAIILPDEPTRRVPTVERRSIDIRGKRVIAVQTKARRLGMYLMGQAYFSKKLIERHGAMVVRTVALCTDEDAVLGPLAREAGIDVVVRPRSG